MRPTTRHLALLAVGAALLLAPDSARAPTVFSLVEVEDSVGVDSGTAPVVVVLALGSDSVGNADAIELVTLDLETGQAAAVGVPRDTWVEYDGETAKINDGLPRGGPQLMAEKVAEVTGVRADYVVTTDLDGFERLVESVGELEVQSDVVFDDPETGLHARPGVNTMSPAQAAAFARSRDLVGDDFTRMANQQHLLQAILDKVWADQDVEGFLEAGALAAVRHLDTALSPAELYRFAQAVTQIDPTRTTRCVLTGPPLDVGVNRGIDLDLAYARRVAADAADGQLEPGTCQG